jgi:GT2 family glycosyltransferase
LALFLSDQGAFGRFRCTAGCPRGGRPDASRRCGAQESAVSAPRVSFVIATYNRRRVLAETLGHLRPGAHGVPTETLVVDNASTDGLGEMLRRDFPWVRLIELPRNEGPCAKNHAVAVAAAPFVFFLDDDSHPVGDTVARAVARLEADPALAVATCRVELPDGRRESSAFPNVFIGCGALLRRDVLQAAGGLPRDFFMAAEEYDTSFRILAAGYDVRTFPDLLVHHGKTPVARQGGRTSRLDVRNNLLTFTRRFPAPFSRIYARELIWRYWRLARGNRRTGAFLRGMIGGLARVLAARVRREPRYPPAVLDRLIAHERVEAWMAEMQQRHALRRVLLADVGKNLFVYWRACRRLGIEMLAIAENGGPWQHKRYRGLAILPDHRCERLAADAVVLTNVSPAHGPPRLRALQEAFDLPVLHRLEAP